MRQDKYIRCPYCSRSIVESKFKKTSFNISPLEFPLVHIREQRSGIGFKKSEGKKKNAGFFLVKGSGKTILDLVNGTREEREVANKIIRRIKTIYEAYRKKGLI